MCNHQLQEDTCRKKLGDSKPISIYYCGFDLTRSTAARNDLVDNLLEIIPQKYIVCAQCAHKYVPPNVKGTVKIFIELQQNLLARRTSPFRRCE